MGSFPVPELTTGHVAAGAHVTSVAGLAASTLGGPGLSRGQRAAPTRLPTDLSFRQRTRGGLMAEVSFL